MSGKTFLTVCDYGQGAVWLHVIAESEAEITRQFPDLRVVGVPPTWMTDEDLGEIRTVGIDDGDDPFLTSLRREPAD